MTNYLSCLEEILLLDSLHGLPSTPLPETPSQLPRGLQICLVTWTLQLRICGGSCSASRNKKRARGMSEFMVGFKESSHEIREAIDGVAE